MRESLAGIYIERYHGLLRHAAECLLWDWSEAAKLAEAAWRLLEAKRHKIEAEAARYQDHEHYNGVLLGAVCGTITNLIVDRRRELGYDPPKSEAGIRAFVTVLEFSQEWAADQRARRAELAERINALPPTLREALHTWLADRRLDPAMGARVRVGLKLLNRRAA